MAGMLLAGGGVCVSAAPGRFTWRIDPSGCTIRVCLPGRLESCSGDAFQGKIEDDRSLIRTDTPAL